MTQDISRPPVKTMNIFRSQCRNQPFLAVRNKFHQDSATSGIRRARAKCFRDFSDNLKTLTLE